MDGESFPTYLPGLVGRLGVSGVDWTFSKSDPAGMRYVLERALGIRGVVKKRRDVVLIDRTRVHLDLVEGLGSFVELEVVLSDGEPIEIGERISQELMTELDISDSALISKAYIDLMESQAL